MNGKIMVRLILEQIQQLQVNQRITTTNVDVVQTKFGVRTLIVPQQLDKV